jgi:hypothetical protein
MVILLVHTLQSYNKILVLVQIFVSIFLLLWILFCCIHLLVLLELYHLVLELCSPILLKFGSLIVVIIVDDCSYVRHSPGHKPEREPLRGVCGSYLRQSWNVEMASSLQRVEKNSR